MINGGFTTASSLGLNIQPHDKVKSQGQIMEMYKRSSGCGSSLCVLCFVFFFVTLHFCVGSSRRSDRPENTLHFLAKCLLFLSAIRVKHDNNQCSVFKFYNIQIKKVMHLHFFSFLKSITAACFRDSLQKDLYFFHFLKLIH